MEVHKERIKLLFKHFPEGFDENDCKTLFNNLGAISSTFLRRAGNFRNCVVAEFDSSEYAWKIIHGMHQHMLLGKRISVEFWQPNQNFLTEEAKSNAENESFSKVQGSIPVRAFAPCWDPDFPVLHIMNKLHLPAPFTDPEHFPGSLVVVDSSELPHLLTTSNDHLAASSSNLVESEEETMELSSGPESELESESDTDKERKNVQTLKVPPQKRKRIRKKLKQTPLLPISSQKSLGKQTVANMSDVFETIQCPSKLHLHVPTDLHMAHKNPSEDVVGGFGKLHSAMPTSNFPESLEPLSAEHHIIPDSQFQLRKGTESEHTNIGDTASEDDRTLEQPTNPTDQLRSFSLNSLRANRLGIEDRLTYNVFARGYDPGVPTSRLYVKNLASSVTEEELYRLFGAFKNGPVHDLDYEPLIHPTDSSRFGIRLLTRGRMKGQAFVTLPCEQSASQALEAINGFMLHDRPMVVMFARGAAGKVDEKAVESV